MRQTSTVANHPCPIFTVESIGNDLSTCSKNPETPKPSSKFFGDACESKSRLKSFDENCDDLNDRCCFGFCNVKIVLQLVALFNFILDAICIFLSLNTFASYLFALSTTGSLLCLCAIITASQEEKQKMLATTTIWTSLKILVIGILYVTATAGIIEFYFSDNSFYLSVELTILFIVIPFCLLMNLIQWKLTQKVVNLIRAKDVFYVIPSAHGSVQMRPSLRLYLAAKRLSSLQTV